MKKDLLMLLFIILVGGFVRFYQITRYPVQLNHDEISQLYDAISVAKTGKDIYGNFLPIVFESTHDFKSPFYTYATAISYLFTGHREITVKIPGALFGTLIIFAVYWFALSIFKNRILATVAAAICAMSPFEIFFARKSFENVAGIFFLLMGFSSLLTYVEKNKKRWGFFAVAFFAAAMYTYFSHAILIPIMFATSLLIFRKFFLNHLKGTAVIVSIWVILILPLVIIILTNPATRYRGQAVFITQDLELGKLINYAKENGQVSELLKLKIIFYYSFNRTLKQLDPIYLFANGLDFTNQGPVNMGLFYFVSLPFLVWGTAKFLKSRIPDFLNNKLLILSVVLIGILPSGLTFEPTSPHRSIVVFTILDILTALGVYEFIRYINVTKKVTRIPLFSFGVILTFWNILYFTQMYTTNYPYEKSQNIHYPFKQVSEYIWSQHPKYDQIVFDPVYGEVAPVRGVAAHYYLGYYGNYPPADFQRDYLQDAKLGVEKLDKISIRDIDWRKDDKLKNTLLIGSPWNLPITSIDKNRVIKIFYYYNKQPAFYAVSLNKGVSE